MDSQPDQLSKLLLEADGLLLLLHRHRDETPVDVIKLLRKKLELILILTDGLDEADDEKPQEPIMTSSIDSDKHEENESTGEYIEDTIEDPEPVRTPKSEPITPLTTAVTFEEEEVATDEPVFIEEDRQPVFIDQEESTVFFGDEPLQPEPEPESALESDNEIVEEDETGTEEMADQPVYHRTYIVNDTAASGEQHTARRPVSSVFNLNDKFRFRRELFGNSDAQYVECLDILSAMSSLDEAREYLLDDLKWDADNEDVKAFLELLANYYR